jgi:S-adenosyl-L-methionine hydrolase (adenosine-forming)
VDPGVGTATRRPLAVRLSGGGYLVGPDNGLLGPAAAALGAVAAAEVDVTALGGPVAPTFHGRDVFAPAAILLAGGAPLDALGPPVPVDGIASPPLPPATVAEGVVEAEVLGADRFGNVALLAAGPDLAAAGLTHGTEVVVTTARGDLPATVGRVFADVPLGDLVVLVDSHGHVAVAAHGSDAETRLGAGPGRVLRIARRSSAGRRRVP